MKNFLALLGGIFTFVIIMLMNSWIVVFLDANLQFINSIALVALVYLFLSLLAAWCVLFIVGLISRKNSVIIPLISVFIGSLIVPRYYFDLLRILRIDSSEHATTIQFTFVVINLLIVLLLIKRGQSKFTLTPHEKRK